MGTPDFAVTPMKLLHEGGHEIVGVVTQPDKPQGRKMIPTPSSVKVAAQNMGLDVYTPQKLKNGELAPVLDELKPDVIIVVAYGKILPGYVLDYPEYGCINLHGSILPKYRGAAPMQRSIMNGERQVGATIMYMNAGMDTGDMIEKYVIDLSDDMTLGDLHDDLSLHGGELLLKVIDDIENGRNITAVAQDESLASYAPKIENEDMLVNFCASAKQVHDHIRGLSPSPLAFAYLNGKKIKIVHSSIVEQQSENDSAGEVIALNKSGIVVACKHGSILIDAVIPEGKKQMDARSFINGRGVEIGDIFSAE